MSIFSIFAETFIVLSVIFTLTISAQQIDSARQESSFPSFDEMEFDITGTEIISLPPLSKHPVDDVHFFDVRKVRIELPEHRLFFVDKTRNDEISETDSMSRMQGRALLSYGRFTTPHLEASYASSHSRSSFFAEGMYESSNGLVRKPNSDYEQMSFSFSGKTNIANWNLSNDDIIVSGKFQIATHQYRFFGSTTPSLQRKTTNVGIYSEIEPLKLLNTEHQFFLSWNSFFINDLLTRSEHHLQIAGEGIQTFNDMKIQTNGNISLNFLQHARSYPFIVSVAGQTEILKSNRSKTIVGIEGFLYQHSNSVLQASLYPQLRYTYSSAPYWTISLLLHPRVQRQTMFQLLTIHPYVENRSEIFYQNIFLDGLLEGTYHPTSVLTIHSSLVFQKSSKYPIFRDTLMQGKWFPDYTGLTTLLEWSSQAHYSLKTKNTLYGEIVLRSISNNSLKNSTELAYIHAAELNGGYVHHFDFALETEIRCSFLVREKTQTLGNVLLTDMLFRYPLNRNFSMRGSINNLFDETYFVWENYRGERLFYAIGVVGRW
ncbi:MAG: TonB-dependent receptor [Ignavibacteria bacterium]|nr:TonB-dependent receptor [Ignavibacteria bacterium]